VIPPNGAYEADHKPILEDVFRLKANVNYKVSVIYEEKWPDGWAGKVNSNIALVR